MLHNLIDSTYPRAQFPVEANAYLNACHADQAMEEG